MAINLGTKYKHFRSLPPNHTSPSLIIPGVPPHPLPLPRAPLPSSTVFRKLYPHYPPYPMISTPHFQISPLVLWTSMGSDPMEGLTARQRNRVHDSGPSKFLGSFLLGQTMCYISRFRILGIPKSKDTPMSWAIRRKFNIDDGFRWGTVFQTCQPCDLTKDFCFAIVQSSQHTCLKANRLAIIVHYIPCILT